MVSQRVNAERLMLLAWPRAILLQLAHPLVAAGVAGHSRFAEGPRATAARLLHTVRAMLALTFGDGTEQQATIERILQIHRHVHGSLAATVGPFRAGTSYSAEDPALVLWVHLTLLESIVLVHDQLFPPLSEAERDVYCAEAAWVACALGARQADVPRTWDALGRAVASAHESGVLVVGPDARAVAAHVMAPPFGPLAYPLSAAVRFVTRAWLPEPIRTQYGLEWSAADARRLPVMLAMVRAARRMLPARAAHWPESRQVPRRSAPPNPDSRLGAAGCRPLKEVPASDEIDRH
jgi:uncharacterized protein (DUF2236 family)